MAKQNKRTLAFINKIKQRRDRPQITKRTYEDILNKDYRQYALYTIYNRAIPDVRDGLKTGARKIISEATRNPKLKNGNKMKVVGLTGYLMARGDYDHGDNSITETIVVMGQSFKSAIPYFDSIGQFGDVYTPESGSPRYLSIKVSKAYNLLFSDMNLVNKQYYNGIEIEPEYYLPIIPTTLINSINGIAVAYSTKKINKNPIELINACIEYIKKGEIPDNLTLTPYIDGVQGKWLLNRDTGTYFNLCNFDRINKTTIHITELSYKMTMKKFESLLISYVNDGTINSFSNKSVGTKKLYEIKFQRGKLSELTDKEILKMFNLLVKVDQESIYNISTKNKIKRYDTVAEIIREFIDWRLEYYKKRKTKTIEDLIIKNERLSSRVKFNNLYKERKIDINTLNDTKMFEKILTEYNLPLWLMDIKIVSLLSSNTKLLEDGIKANNLEIERIKTMDIIDMYIDDLVNLKKQLMKLGYRAYKPKLVKFSKV